MILEKIAIGMWNNVGWLITHKEGWLFIIVVALIGACYNNKD